MNVTFRTPEIPMGYLLVKKYEYLREAKAALW
jgi:hypothetical protein